MKNRLVALLIIGNEILSGRTSDQNLNYIAKKLTDKGLELKEVRVVADINQDIVSAIIHLKNKYDYVLTTGGIGVTHDDITFAAVANAFGVELQLNNDILSILKKYLAENFRDIDHKMAYIPIGATPISLEAQAVPCFYIENVYVMAGSPNVMNMMLEYVLTHIPNGSRLYSYNLELEVLESKIATEFAQLQAQYPQIKMGSYPFTQNSSYFTELILTSINEAELKVAYHQLIDICNNLQIAPHINK